MELRFLKPGCLQSKYIPYFIGYKPRPAISRDPKLLTLKLNTIVFKHKHKTFSYNPYEQRNAAAALQQFTFMVAQRLSVCKAELVSR